MDSENIEISGNGAEDSNQERASLSDEEDIKEIYKYCYESTDKEQDHSLDQTIWDKSLYAILITHLKEYSKPVKFREILETNKQKAKFILDVVLLILRQVSV